jgi:hypothetical protein
VRPGTAVEGAARGLHGGVDVGAIAFRNMGEHFAGSGIISLKSLARCGIDPLAVNQHLARLGNKIADTRIDLNRRNCDAHTSSLSNEQRIGMKEVCEAQLPLNVPTNESARKNAKATINKIVVPRIGGRQTRSSGRLQPADRE